MGQLGADVEQLDRLADKMDAEGADLRAAARATTWLFATTWWQGPDSVSSRNWWKTTGKPQMERAAGWLEDLKDQLRRQADQQRETSKGKEGGGQSWWDRAKGAVKGAWDGVTSWTSSAWNSTTAFLHDIGTTVDDLGNQGLPSWVPTPVRNVVDPIIDRGGTWFHYAWDTGWRRITDPLQTIKDLRTGTLVLEDIAAAQAILGEDAEIYEPDDPRLEGAMYLTGASVPGGAGAITLGHTVRIAEEGTPDHSLLAHELQHVRDVEDVGGLSFYGSYGASYVGNYAVLWIGEQLGHPIPTEIDGNRVTDIHDAAYRLIPWERRAYQLDNSWEDSNPNNDEIPEGILGGWGKFLPGFPIGPLGLSYT